MYLSALEEIKLEKTMFSCMETNQSGQAGHDLTPAFDSIIV